MRDCGWDNSSRSGVGSHIPFASYWNQNHNASLKAASRLILVVTLARDRITKMLPHIIKGKIYIHIYSLQTNLKFLKTLIDNQCKDVWSLLNRYS